jgi:hypothetical protein
MRYAILALAVSVGCAARAPEVFEVKDTLKGQPRLEVTWPEYARFKTKIGFMVVGSPSLFEGITVVMIDVNKGYSGGVIRVNPNFKRWYEVEFVGPEKPWCFIEIGLYRITALDVYGRPGKYVRLDIQSKMIPSALEAGVAQPFQPMVSSCP